MTGTHSWAEALAVYRQPKVISMIFLGFAAGLPFLLVFSTLSAWLRDEGTARTVIGFFSWVGITYSIKVIWAPVVDRFKLPLLHAWLGRRRSWMFLAQFGIAAGLVGMSLCNVHSQLQWIAAFALLVAFSSATQDITLDAYRIEIVDKQLQGAMAAAYVLGYRVALLMAGAGAFYLAEYWTWSVAYQSMAALMGIGVFTTLLVSEPIRTASPYPSGKTSFTEVLKQSIVDPFVEFFRRNGRMALLILGLVAVYKISDITMGVMANPFYLDLGFSKTEIADVTKVFGFFMTIAGAAAGGLLVVRYGILKPLLLGAILVATTNLLFAMLALMEPSLFMLATVVSADNLSGGIATSVFIAWLSSLTSQTYTATQYALFSSLMTLPAKFLGGFSGVVVDQQGYDAFFVYAAVLGIPAIVLAYILIRIKTEA